MVSSASTQRHEGGSQAVSKGRHLDFEHLLEDKGIQYSSSVDLTSELELELAAVLLVVFYYPERGDMWMHAVQCTVNFYDEVVVHCLPRHIKLEAPSFVGDLLFPVHRILRVQQTTPYLCFKS